MLPTSFGQEGRWGEREGWDGRVDDSEGWDGGVGYAGRKVVKGWEGSRTWDESEGDGKDERVGRGEGVVGGTIEGRMESTRWRGSFGGRREGEGEEEGRGREQRK